MKQITKVTYETALRLAANDKSSHGLSGFIKRLKLLPKRLFTIYY